MGTLRFVAVACSINEAMRRAAPTLRTPIKNAYQSKLWRAQHLMRPYSLTAPGFGVGQCYSTSHQHCSVLWSYQIILPLCTTSPWPSWSSFCPWRRHSKSLMMTTLSIKRRQVIYNSTSIDEHGWTLAMNLWMAWDIVRLCTDTHHQSNSINCQAASFDLMHR